jgi:hypothetical protein
MRRFAVLALSCFTLLSPTACAPSSASSKPATYEGVPLKGDPGITFSTAGDMLLIEVTSPTGIGSAAVEKTSGQWPGKIVMRLHVKGLESFTFRYADVRIDASVSSHGDNAVSEAYQQSGTSGAAAPGDPYWIAIAPGEGYFDLEAPADFVKSGEDKFAIEWIDFYR